MPALCSASPCGSRFFPRGSGKGEGGESRKRGLTAIRCRCHRHRPRPRRVDGCGRPSAAKRGSYKKRETGDPALILAVALFLDQLRAEQAVDLFLERAAFVVAQVDATGELDERRVV